MTSRKTLILLAAGGSAALLLGALYFQVFENLPPCKLCIWQRWPHGAALVIAAAALATRGPALPLAGAVSALTTGAVGLYHTGVEREWWDGPSTCTSSQSITDMSPARAADLIMNMAIQRCDEVLWSFLGLSMASWNALASLAFALLWVAAARRSR
ncbi:dihydroneopterin aldolase [Salipiger aestuarii]|jgi:disulfide bond formation protein DsbB|uniref:disulfide bond formation protein B n=1 Tax=Salipiger aestuarii TaxID=568098 RepID=UPI00123AC289|nr:disulfide bond formation protein B [Salipiger aestuarii]KAA8609037.1 dihydroneopterin aldolase [Salipiger aestuarii]KAA8614240.1 dihydroneopterin aldolase [Salipiger aestuarii]